MTEDSGDHQFGVVSGRYELVEIIGSGGMGVVYRARDRVLDRAVAVKMIREELANPDFVRRFEREAAILARLRSPHIVVVYDYGQHEDKFFLVTDFLPDGDLQAWLHDHGPMSAEQAVPLVAQLAEGLRDAHDLGVIHRDIKPGNVLLWRRGADLRPVLADFGIAVVSDLALTATGGVVGSPQYMAPERHLGRPATVATDVYAMGCLLYTLLVARPPFQGTEFQVANAHLTEPVPALPARVRRGAEIDRIIRDCTAKDPTQRIGSAAELAQRLTAVGRLLAPPETVPASRATVERPSSSGASTTVLTPVPAADGGGERPGRRSGRGVIAAIVTLVVVALAAGGAWWALARDTDSGPPAAGTTPSPTVTASTPAAPAAPGPVEARAVPAERAVRVTAEVPAPVDGVEFRLERQDDGWRQVRPTFEVPTKEGGAPACATLRLVAVGEGGRTAGPDEEFCARAKPPRVELLANPAPCTSPDSAGCDWIDIALHGFRTDASYRVAWAVASEVGGQLGPFSPSLPRTTDEDGRALIEAHQSSGGPSSYCPTGQCPGGIPVSRQFGSMVVRVLDGGGAKVLHERAFALDEYR